MQQKNEHKSQARQRNALKLHLCIRHSSDEKCNSWAICALNSRTIFSLLIFFFSSLIDIQLRISLQSLGGNVTGLLRLRCSKTQAHTVGTSSLEGESIVGVEFDDSVLAVECEPVTAKSLTESYKRLYQELA